MENSTKYNGWTNYETWRVALEMFDGDGDHWEEQHGKEVWDMAEAMKEHVLDILQDDAEGFALMYARAFVSNVNFIEIAQHVIDEYHVCECDHCGGPVKDIEDNYCSDICKDTQRLEYMEE